MSVVDCPACNRPVAAADINRHLDSGCQSHVAAEAEPDPSSSSSSTTASRPVNKRAAVGSFFAIRTPSAKRVAVGSGPVAAAAAPSLQNQQQQQQTQQQRQPTTPAAQSAITPTTGSKKRSAGEAGFGSPPSPSSGTATAPAATENNGQRPPPPPLSKKKHKSLAAVPLAERVRPESLDEIEGQDLLAPHTGVLRTLIETSDQGHPLPSMILWGGPGTGKTTIARCVARHGSSARFVELSAASAGVAECKRLFAEAAAELSLTGRRTVVFCDEIHRFSKTQQDVFLAPVEAGTVTLIGATTENPSFKVQAALLSRCRTFALQKLGDDHVVRILRRALAAERARIGVGGGREAAAEEKEKRQDMDGKEGEDEEEGDENETEGRRDDGVQDDDMLAYIAAFSDGDARTALNLLEMALSLGRGRGRGPGQLPAAKADLKAALTQTLLYDRTGDHHYDTISAFHKSVRGGDADATLYYLGRMLQSGEDPLFVARRMVVIASEDVGLADSSLLTLATSAHSAVQQVGMPEARIPLAHCAVALALAPKSTRAYRGLGSALAALQEPGVAGLAIPPHLRNAPTRLMRDMGFGAAYKYPPNYRDGRVRQTYLPDALVGRRFLEDLDLGTEVDADLGEERTGM